MCIGVPMQVIVVEDHTAIATVDGERRRISTLLLDGPLSVGAHVLVHGDRAVRTMAADEAALVADALRAVLAASDGHDFEHLIADLVDREPQLPDHLKA
jgi:hydrogenase expression/formation protein HypC